MPKKKRRKTTSNRKPAATPADDAGGVATLELCTSEPATFDEARQPDGSYRTPKDASRLLIPISHLAALAEPEDDSESVDSTQSKASDGASRGFSGQANSGQVFSHWWYGQMAVDMSGLKIPSQVQPVLLDHRSDAILGQTSKIEVDDDNSLQATGEIHTVTDHGRDCVALLDAGVPYQMSVYVPPDALEYVEPGAEVEVNGHTMTGPGVIYRKATLREVTITALGQDPNTQAALLTRGPKGGVEFENLRVEVSQLSKDNEEMSKPTEKGAEALSYSQEEHEALLAEAVSEAVTSERARLSAIDELVADTGMPAEEVAKFRDSDVTPGEVGIAVAQFMKKSKANTLRAITDRDKFSNDDGDADVDTGDQAPNGKGGGDKLTLKKVAAMELGEERFGHEFDLDFEGCKAEFAEREDYIAYREHSTETRA